MTVLHSRDQLLKEESGFILIEAPSFRYPVKQLTPRCILHGYSQVCWSQEHLQEPYSFQRYNITLQPDAPADFLLKAAFVAQQASSDLVSTSKRHFLHCLKSRQGTLNIFIDVVCPYLLELDDIWV